MPKFQKMSKINYREVDKADSPHSCTSPGCTLYATSRDGVIDIKRWKKETQVYSIGMRKRKTSQVSFRSQLLDQNMEQYINIKVCYYKFYIADTYI